MKSDKNRKRIPEEIAAAVMHKAERTCCICKKRNRRVQIHHIDGDSSNNKPQNLVVLCVLHHDEASIKSSISRGISPAEIRKYRAEWYKIVDANRKAKKKSFVKPDASPEAHIEALACHEVRKISFDLNDKWDIVEECLNKIAPYVVSWKYGDQVHEEVLDVLTTVVSRTRTGMPETTANAIEHLAYSALPIVSLVNPTNKLPTTRQKKQFQSVISIGFSIAHDGIKYLKNFEVTVSGVHLLRAVLRYAHLNNLKSLKTECLENFAHLIEVAGYAEDEKAKDWIIFDRDDALALDGDPLPKMPGRA